MGALKGRLKRSAASCGAGEGSKGSGIASLRGLLAPGTLSCVWLATGGASLRVLGGGGTKDPSPERMGKNLYWFTIWARALGNASTVVKRDVVQLVWQHGARTSLAPLTFRKCISIATMIEYYPQLLVTLPAS